MVRFRNSSKLRSLTNRILIRKVTTYIGLSLMGAGLQSAVVYSQEWTRTENTITWMIPGEGTQGRCQVHATIPGRRLEFGYFFVDQRDGAILKRDLALRHRPPILNRRGEPQFAFPKDPDYLEYAFAEGNAIAVVPEMEFNSNGLKEYCWMAPGDRYFAWYAIEGSSMAWWRYCAHADRPKVLTSVESKSNVDRIVALPNEDHGTHQISIPGTIATTQEPTPASQRFDVSIVFQPIALEDTYTVYQEGEQFEGSPAKLSIDVPGEDTNQGLGLLYNDHSLHHRALRVTHIRVESPGLVSPDREQGAWHPLVDNEVQGSFASRKLVDPRLHGSIEVYSNGGLQFEPNRDDPYWSIDHHPVEPIPVYVQYKVSDGLSSTISRFGIGHGYYHRGQPHDQKHDGISSYFLGGGGNGKPFVQGRRKFFSSSAAGKDIVLIAQCLENREFADLVFEDFAGGKARSIYSLNLTTRDQADDPRIASIIAGADVIWIGGGSQSHFHDSWKGTRLFQALEIAASKGVSIGGTSAGTAIMSHAAYVNLPWDSASSSFTLQDPTDERNRILFQGLDTLPFSALSASEHAPLHRILVDTHFSELNRMGRLVAFTSSQPFLMGLGIDSSTAVLIEKEIDDWKWSVHGAGSVFVIESPRNQFSNQLHPLALRPRERINVIQLKAGQSLSLSAILQSPLSHRVFLSKNTVFTPDYSGKIYGRRGQ